jgi:AAA domain-containing protein
MPTITPATASSFAGLRIEKVHEVEPNFNMLVYGRSGVGKTRLAGSAFAVPEMNRLLMIDIEGGSLTLRKDFPDVELVRVQNWTDMQKVYDGLYAGGHGFKTVILDSLTEIQKFNMSDIMRKLVDKTDGERDMDVPSLREYLKNLEQTRRFVRAFRDLPINVIFTALEREDKDRMNRPIKLPSLSGKMSQEVAAFLDIVLYYATKEVEGPDGKRQLRVLQSQATESTIAKDRSGLLPPVMTEPDMAKLYDIIVRKTSRPKMQGNGTQPVTEEEAAKLTS